MELVKYHRAVYELPRSGISHTIRSRRVNDSLITLQTFSFRKKMFEWQLCWGCVGCCAQRFGFLPMTHFYSLLEDPRISQKATECLTVGIVALKKTHQPFCQKTIPAIKEGFYGIAASTKHHVNLSSTLVKLWVQKKKIIKGPESPFGPHRAQ